MRTTPQRGVFVLPLFENALIQTNPAALDDVPDGADALLTPKADVETPIIGHFDKSVPLKKPHNPR